MIFSEKLFLNQNIIVTGATRGIGKEIADNLSKLGAKLILTGTNESEVNNLNRDNSNPNIKYICVNFKKENEVNYFLNYIDSLEKIDGLVNNAGINILNDINDIESQDFDDIIDVNLKTPLLLTKSVSSIMKKNNFGRIVNISSIFGKITREKRTAYTASKFGLHGLTIGSSVDLAKFNILINTISPGFVLTDLTRKNLTDSEMVELSNQIPIKRLAKVHDIFQIVLFLLSKGNTYITGQNIFIDGGYTNV